MESQVDCRVHSGSHDFSVDHAIDIRNEPAHDKTYNKIYVTSNDSAQPVHPPSMTFLVYPSLDSLEAVEDTCDQRILWSDCADAQADPSLCWSHKSYCRFCRKLAQMYIYQE